MSGDEKLTPSHLERAAYVYVRQSSPSQVRHNLESQRRQYGLAGRARELGFGKVEVIDEDLGRSGSGSVECPGFGRLLTAVCEGEAGVVFAVDNFNFGSAPHNLIIDYPQTGYASLYGHLFERPALEVGQTVEQGEVHSFTLTEDSLRTYV